jgi:hypothetical protein
MVQTASYGMEVGGGGGAGAVGANATGSAGGAGGKGVCNFYYLVHLQLMQVVVAVQNILVDPLLVQVELVVLR